MCEETNEDFVPRITVPNKEDRRVLAEALTCFAHHVSHNSMQAGGIETLAQQLRITAALMTEIVNQAHEEIMEELGVREVPDNLAEMFENMPETFGDEDGEC